MKEKLIDLKEVPLKNNCPECYSRDGLRLTFKQKLTENSFIKSITPEIHQVLECKTCGTIIYPVRWTNDIERVVTYHTKALKPRNRSTHLKKTSWLIITLIILLAIAATGFTFYL
ncbi:hypothetical protein KFZ70_03705 [Tamlana fucoidanivorans]|uniref:Uncharacterized protein n=2 Tax=Allotamlana fucoidanivorans TaxID=2583814 RepID=A0A5C4SKF8_9FLAO|nr:hypothetical protein FGF67_09215 [Tamlana fucoidanivorans]